MDVSIPMPNSYLSSYHIEEHVQGAVVVNAPIAELYITAPGKYEELLTNSSSQVKLATHCATAIQEDPAIEDSIKAFKTSVTFDLANLHEISCHCEIVPGRIV
ncbi:hypothetical protein H4Q32_026941 [Labeo rohita]|uniref:Uncharacterized protein n=1 Tax=Labeo rohita TaxID=84645 RepID=A0ABQ8L0T3_LABRO|nr:hypothetical protein H4Q32_026941 [Labeo rohita]